jgi:hypothetical protein
MNTVRMMAGVAALAALAGCTSAGPSGGGGSGVVARAPTGVEGQWMDPNGAVSTFSGGVFQTTALDTGERLSEGRYVMMGPADIAITGTSLARQRRGLPSNVSFNCRQASVNQLNCTSSEGVNFVLSRRGAIS